MNIKTKIMEETRIKETLIFEINGHQVEAINEGIAKMSDQSRESIPALKDYLTKQIEDGKTKGFLPYSNFESAINWQIIGRKLELAELKERYIKVSGYNNAFEYWNTIMMWWTIRDQDMARKCTTTDLQKICLLSELSIDEFGNNIEEE